MAFDTASEFPEGQMRTKNKNFLALYGTNYQTYLVYFEMVHRFFMVLTSLNHFET